MKLILMTLDEAQRGQSPAFCFYNRTLTATEDVQILIDHPEVILLCDVCERNLCLAVSIVGIHAGKGERWDTCVTCFSKKIEEFSQYYVRPCTNFATTTDRKWSIGCRLLLLQALQKYKENDWKEVKNYLDYHGHHFEEEEIEAYYRQFIRDKDLEKQQKVLMEVDVPNKYRIKGSQRYQTEESMWKFNNKPLPFEAYNAKRDEYAYIYDPEAEESIADLEFRDDDTEQVFELKMQMLAKYQERIDERQKREVMVKEHGLLSTQRDLQHLTESKVRNKIRDGIDSLLRFQSSQEADKLVGSLALREELKALIRLLNRCRRMDRSMTFEATFTLLEKKRLKRQERSKTTSKDFKVIFERQALKQDKEEEDEGLQLLRKKVKEGTGMDWKDYQVRQVSGLNRLLYDT